MLERRSTKGSSLFEAAARSFHIGITRRYKGSFERWNGIGHEKADRSVDCSSETRSYIFHLRSCFQTLRSTHIPNRDLLESHH